MMRSLTKPIRSKAPFSLLLIDKSLVIHTTILSLYHVRWTWRPGRCSGGCLAAKEVGGWPRSTRGPSRRQGRQPAGQSEEGGGARGLVKVGGGRRLTGQSELEEGAEVRGPIQVGGERRRAGPVYVRGGARGWSESEAEVHGPCGGGETGAQG